MIAGLTLDAVIDALADRIAERIAARDSDLIDQRSRKGLRGRLHIEAVRRRVAERTGDAFIRGKDYLMTPEAVRDELRRRAADAGAPGAVTRVRDALRGKRSPKAAERAELDALKRELESDMRDAGRR